MGDNKNMSKYMHRDVVIGLIVIVAIAFFATWATMTLWNWLMPRLFGFPLINLMDAAAMLTLTSLLLYRG